jgi:AcrR family transcriptional regulator
MESTGAEYPGTPDTGHHDTPGLEMRYLIAETAVDLWEQNGGGFTLAEVARVSGISEKEIRSHFRTKDDILRFWYEALVHRYRLMVADLDGYESLTLSEKISNFIYASLEMLGERRAFTAATFDELICEYRGTTGLVNGLEQLVGSFIEDDERVPGLNRLFTGSLLYHFLADEYLHIVRFWIEDESENNEKTLELVDKLTSFLEELLYNAVVTRGFDLARFLYEHGALRIPSLLNYTRRFLPF